MSKKKPQTFAQHIFEVRYKPNTIIIDRRGAILKKLLVSPFTTGNIGANTVRVSTKDTKDLNAFLGYSNFGLSASILQTKKSFLNHSSSLVYNALSNFVESKDIVRIGVRTKILSEKAGFIKLVESINKHFAIKNDIISQFGKTEDIGFAFDLKDKDDCHKSIHIKFGPLKKEEYENDFTIYENLPDCGFFVDIDIFKDDYSNKLFKPKEMNNFIKANVELAYTIHEQINSCLEQ